MRTFLALFALTGCQIFAANIPPIDITKPPTKDEYTVLLLHLNKGDGAVADDDSGLANAGKISGATWCDGKFGKALQFDGVDDYVTCRGERHEPPHFDFGENTDFTVEFWVNTTTTVRGSPFLNKRQRGGHDDPGFAIYTDIGQARATICDGINLVGLLHSAPITDGKWHHIALVVERKAKATLYVDGVAGKPELVSYLTDITNPKRELRIMDRGHDAGTKGMIDEIRISKVARPMSAPKR